MEIKGKHQVASTTVKAVQPGSTATPEEDMYFMITEVERYRAALQHISDCTQKDAIRAKPYDDSLAEHLAEVANNALEDK
jgi:hypothetical protein